MRQGPTWAILVPLPSTQVLSFLMCDLLKTGMHVFARSPSRCQTFLKALVTPVHMHFCICLFCETLSCMALRPFWTFCDLTVTSGTLRNTMHVFVCTCLAALAPFRTFFHDPVESCCSVLAVTHSLGGPACPLSWCVVCCFLTGRRSMPVPVMLCMQSLSC